MTQSETLPGGTQIGRCRAAEARERGQPPTKQTADGAGGVVPSTWQGASKAKGVQRPRRRILSVSLRNGKEHLKRRETHFFSGPGVKTLPFNAGGTGSIPGQRAKIP